MLRRIYRDRGNRRDNISHRQRKQGRRLRSPCRQVRHDCDAGDAVARVDAYLGSLKTLGAHFLQVVRDKDGQITDRASGTLSIARPNRFRWDYREPYSQTIVADGRKLWLYDPDLDQVTVRSLEQGLGATPAMLLSGAGKVGDAFKSAGDRAHGRLDLVPARAEAARARISNASASRSTPRANSPRWNCRTSSARRPRSSSATVKRGTVVDESLFDFQPPPAPT